MMDDESGESMEPIEELPLIELCESELEIIYKSLFTENSIAIQKHSSSSINTNKIQYKIQ